MLTTTNLSSSLTKRTFDQGEIIPHGSNSIWRIEKGIVRTITWNDGMPTVSGYWGANDIIGQPLSSTKSYNMQCWTSVEVSFIPESQWQQVPESIRAYTQQRIETFLKIVQCKRVHQRLQSLLVWLSQSFGHQSAEGTLIDLPLSYQEVADVIGTTRVTAMMVVQQLENAGVIIRFSRRFVLLKAL